ncbi:MAG: alpha/beta hydrolase, partial [Candidatus Obscuribacterales bacterium]|nr:alpha/beta hydrolase [Candidatus Obscuribacterales bacterium]
MNENHDEAKKITKLPVLMVQGSNDKLVKPEGTEELFDELKTPEKKLIMVEDGQHLIFEDKQFSQSTLNDVADWIASHSPAIEDSALDIGMEKARAEFESNQFAKAAAQLKEVLLIAPKDANVHLLMGKTQFHLGHFLLARQHLMNAIRLDGRGTLIAQEANTTLLSLPQQIRGTHRNLPPALRGAKAKRIQQPPTVLVFNAKWSRPGKDMDDVVSQAKARYGNRVVFKNIDVDDPVNSGVVEQYDIGPVPTTVFLDTNGNEASIQVGYAGLDGMLKGLQKILFIH